MSSAVGGIWVCRGGETELIPVLDRDDLEGELIQDALHDASDPNIGVTLGCACRDDSHIPSLRPRETQRSNLACVRSIVADHSPSCVFDAIYGQRAKLLISHSVFATSHSSFVPASIAPPRTTSIERNARHLTFPNLVSQLVAEANADAFCNANLNLPISRNAFLPDLFSAWERSLMIARFAGGVDARRASQANGVTLGIGVIFHSVPRCSDEMIILPVSWWDGSGLCSEIVIARRDLVDDAFKNIAAHGRAMAAPYLVIATLLSDGTITNLWVRAMWTDGSRYALVESETERTYFATLHGTEIVYKPLLRFELDRLVKHLGLEYAFRWRHRPDVLHFASGKPPRVTEIRGHRPGSFIGYDKNLERALAFYATLQPHFDCVVVDAWLWPKHFTPLDCDSWLVANKSFSGIKPAAAKYIAESAAQLVSGLHHERV